MATVKKDKISESEDQKRAESNEYNERSKDYTASLGACPPLSLRYLNEPYDPNVPVMEHEILFGTPMAFTSRHFYNPMPILAPIPERILNQVIEVIGSYESAMKWLTKPSIALGSIPPLTFMLTQNGVEQVENELIRIEAGVL